MEVTIKEAKEKVASQRKKQQAIAKEKQSKRKEMYKKDYLKRKTESDKAKKERMTKIAQEILTERHQGSPYAAAHKDISNK